MYTNTVQLRRIGGWVEERSLLPVPLLLSKLRVASPHEKGNPTFFAVCWVSLLLYPTLYLQALEMCKRMVGEEHPYVAASLNNLALLYYSQGRYAEAEPLYLQALAICEQKLGVNHPHTVKCGENLERLCAANS